MKIKILINKHPLFFAFFIFTIVLILSFVGIFLFWGYLNLYGLSANFWVVLSSISTLIATAAVFGAGYIAYSELSEISQSRYLDVTDRLFKALNSEESILARRWIFQNLSDSLDYSEINSSDAQKHIKHTLNTLDRIAFITKFGFVSYDEIMPWMHPMIVKSWMKLKPIVLAERERRNEPLYYKEAEKLAIRTIEWCKSNNVSTDITWITQAL